jgi:hypothetical protein
MKRENIKGITKEWIFRWELRMRIPSLEGNKCGK